MPSVIEGYRVELKDALSVYESTLRIRIKQDQIVSRQELLSEDGSEDKLYVMLMQNNSTVYRIEEDETTKVDLGILEEEYRKLSPLSLPMGKFEANEVQKFERGQQTVLVKPAYICLRPLPGKEIEIFTDPNYERMKMSLGESTQYFRLERWVVKSSLFLTVKTELCIILNRVSDRLFGITKEKRIEIKEKVKVKIAGNPLWSPSIYGDSISYAMAESLMVKVNELVQIQTDRGKIWRNKATVDAIERGTHAMAGEFVTILLETTDY